MSRIKHVTNYAALVDQAQAEARVFVTEHYATVNKSTPVSLALVNTGLRDIVVTSMQAVSMASLAKLEWFAGSESGLTGGIVEPIRSSNLRLLTDADLRADARIDPTPDPAEIKLTGGYLMGSKNSGETLRAVDGILAVIPPDMYLRAVFSHEESGTREMNLSMDFVLA